MEHGVDSVHGTRRTGGLDEVLCVCQGSKDHLARDLRGWLAMSGPDSSRSMYLEQPGMGRRPAGLGSGSSGGNRSMTPRSTFAWSLGDKDARVAMNVPGSFPRTGSGQSTGRSTQHRNRHGCDR